jgi:hypothetical protein
MMVARATTMRRPSESIEGDTVAVRFSHPFLIRIKKSITTVLPTDQ